MNPWGQHLILDFGGCPKLPVSDREHIENWLTELVSVIGMKPYGPPTIEHFATHSHDAAGFTVMQLIETSNITAHFAENIGKVFIDIFSCKPFDIDKATEVCQAYFLPKTFRQVELSRGQLSPPFHENLHGETVYQGFEVRDVLLNTRSDHQRIKVLETTAYGRVLVLDDIVQTTELDEFMYHEMLVHVPMFTHHKPRRVLIIGGGDGGSLREVLKHPVSHVDMVDIDKQVIEACVELMPGLNNLGTIYQDQRVSLHIADAFDFVKACDEHYDVIICDTTDPVGVGEVLFTSEFYHALTLRLAAGAVMSLQNGIPFLQPDEARRSISKLRAFGLGARCYLTHVPSYYGGPMSLVLASNEGTLLTQQLNKTQSRFTVSQVDCRHYNPEVHVASFALPSWIYSRVESMARS